MSPNGGECQNGYECPNNKWASKKRDPLLPTAPSVPEDTIGTIYCRGSSDLVTLKKDVSNVSPLAILASTRWMSDGP